MIEIQLTHNFRSAGEIANPAGPAGGQNERTAPAAPPRCAAQQPRGAASMLPPFCFAPSLPGAKAVCDKVTYKNWINSGPAIP